MGSHAQANIHSSNLEQLVRTNDFSQNRKHLRRVLGTEHAPAIALSPTVLQSLSDTAFPSLAVGSTGTSNDKNNKSASSVSSATKTTTTTTTTPKTAQKTSKSAEKSTTEKSKSKPQQKASTQ